MLLVACMCLYLPSLSAQDIKTVFLAMPDSITPLLSEVNKADFIDFKASNMEAKVQNKFFRPSIMKTLTADYICIQMTENSTWQMKLLPLGDTYLVGIIETVGTNVKDSRLYLYDLDWQALTAESYQVKVQLADFIKSSAKSSDQVLESSLKALDIHTYLYSFSANTLELVIEFTGLNYLDQELQKKIKDFIKPKLTYQWKTEGFFQIQD